MNEKTLAEALEQLRQGNSEVIVGILNSEDIDIKMFRQEVSKKFRFKSREELLGMVDKLNVRAKEMLLETCLLNKKECPTDPVCYFWHEIVGKILTDDKVSISREVREELVHYPSHKVICTAARRTKSREHMERMLKFDREGACYYDREEEEENIQSHLLERIIINNPYYNMTEEEERKWAMSSYRDVREEVAKTTKNKTILEEMEKRAMENFSRDKYDNNRLLIAIYSNPLSEELDLSEEKEKFFLANTDAIFRGHENLIKRFISYTKNRPILEDILWYCSDKFMEQILQKDICKEIELDFLFKLYKFKREKHNSKAASIIMKYIIEKEFSGEVTEKIFEICQMFCS